MRMGGEVGMKVYGRMGEEGGGDGELSKGIGGGMGDVRGERACGEKEGEEVFGNGVWRRGEEEGVWRWGGRRGKGKLLGLIGGGMGDTYGERGCVFSLCRGCNEKNKKQREEWGGDGWVYPV